MLQRPLVLITLCYVAAIVGKAHGLLPVYVSFPLLAAVALPCVAMSRPRGTAAPPATQVPSAHYYFVAPCLLVASLTIWQLHSSVPRNSPSLHIPPGSEGRPSKCAVLGHVCSDPREVNESLEEFDLQAEALVHHDTEQSVTGKIRVLAPASTSLRYGESVRVVGTLRQPSESSNPGQYSFRQHLKQEGINWECIADEPDALATVAGKPRCDLGRIGSGIRHWTLNLYRTTMPRPYADLAAKLICSIVYGISASPLPADIVEPFRRAGVMHILVASGTQVGLIVGVLLLLCQRSGAPRLAQALIVVSVVLLYTMVAGGQPAIVRSAIMGVVLATALLIRRDFDSWTALSLAALIVLFINPEDLFSIGFQLSFAAVIGLFTVAQRIKPMLRCLPDSVALLVSLTIGAQLMVLPLLAHYFGRVSPVGFLSNLLVVPLAGILVTTGLLTCVAGAVQPALASLINHANYFGVLKLFGLTQYFANFPLASMTVSRPGTGAIVGYYAAIGVAMAFTDSEVRAKWRLERILVAALVAATCWIGFRTLRQYHQDLEVTFLDVGQGEAVVVHSPSGRTIMIDGGSSSFRDGDVGERVLLPFLLTRGVRRLDAVVISHPHADHTNGLPTVLRELPVGMVVDTHQSETSPAHEEIMEVCQSKHIPVRSARRGAVLDLGMGVRMYLLMPISPLLIGTDSDANNNSAVVKLCAGRISLLLTGDLEHAGEARLLKRRDRLASTILKVGHQGSDSSSSPAFLKAVHPEVAIISVGAANAFGHPSREVVQRLRATGARVYRTDLCGAITLRTDGTSYRVETFKPIK